METSKAQEKQNAKQMGVAENAFSKCKHRSVNPAPSFSQFVKLINNLMGLYLQQSLASVV